MPNLTNYWTVISTKLKIQKLCQLPVKAAARKSAEKAKREPASQVLARLGIKGGEKGKNLARKKSSKMRKMPEGGLEM